MAIDRQARMPLYHQIYDQLHAQIESGRFRPGDQIPTESELSETYGVSRITVKQAIQLLVNEGRLERIQGRGTFVSQPKIDRRLDSMISFRDEMLQRGMRPSSRLLELKVVPVSPKVAKSLRLQSGKEVIKIQRLRFADGDVMGIQTAYLPYDLCPELLKEADALESGSLYEILNRKFDLRPARAEEAYSIARLDVHDAKLMMLSEGDPVFQAERISFLPDGRPFEAVWSLLRGDRYTLRVEIIGS